MENLSTPFSYCVGPKVKFIIRFCAMRVLHNLWSTDSGSLIGKANWWSPAASFLVIRVILTLFLINAATFNNLLWKWCDHLSVHLSCFGLVHWKCRSNCWRSRNEEIGYSRFICLVQHRTCQYSYHHLFHVSYVDGIGFIVVWEAWPHPYYNVYSHNRSALPFFLFRPIDSIASQQFGWLFLCQQRSTDTIPSQAKTEVNYLAMVLYAAKCAFKKSFYLLIV